MDDTVILDLRERRPPENEFIILWRAGMKYEGLHLCVDKDPELWIDEQNLPNTSIIRSRVITLHYLLFKNDCVEAAID